MTATRRDFLTAAAAGATLALLRGRARAEALAPVGGSLVASLPSSPVTIDPPSAASQAELMLVGLLFDGLYRLDARAVPQPHLAAALPETVDDGVRIRLRQGVKWHDGHTLGADDVAKSLTRAAGLPLTAWALAPVSSVRVDADGVRLALRRATPELAALLAAPGLAITRGGQPAKLKTASGTGAYRQVKLGAARLELVAFAEHHAGRAYTDKLTLRWFEKPDDEARAYEVGDAHVSTRGAVAFAGHTPKHATAQIDGMATWLSYVGFGRAHAALLADPAFRRALSLALNRAALRHVGSGERIVPALAAASPDLGGQSPSSDEAAAHLDDARTALAEAARRDKTLEAALAGKGNLTLRVIVDRTRLDDADVAARVVAALDALGLRAGFDTLAPEEFSRQAAAGKCDLLIGQLGAPTGDLVGELALAFAAGGDDWATQRLATATLDLAAATGEFARRWPVIPLYHRAVRAHHRKTVHGMGFDAQGRLGFADLFHFAAKGS